MLQSAFVQRVRSADLVYQTWHLFSGFIGVPASHWKASAKAAFWAIGPSTRNFDGECGSIVTC